MDISRYSPGDIRTILNRAGMNRKLELPVPDIDWDNGGAAIRPYLKSKEAIILAPATDIERDRLQSIHTSFQRFNDREAFTSEDHNKRIIMAVAEQRKILGPFKRDHWVTLHFDPQLKEATLLDSRPRWLSFLYPKSAIKNSFIKGIRTLYGEDELFEIKFQTKYQGVQLNDTYCGDWTVRNILDLAGIGSSDEASTIEEQQKKYKVKDERSVVLMNYALSGKEMIKPSLFQRFLAFLGLKSSYEAEIEASKVGAGSTYSIANTRTSLPLANVKGSINAKVNDENDENKGYSSHRRMSF